MVIKLSWLVGRTLAVVLLLCGSYLALIARDSTQALGDFTVFFIISGIALACIGVFGLIVKFK